MVLYGVLDLSIRQVIEFFASRAAAETFIDECLADEPEWRGVLAVRVVSFETSSD